MLSTFYTHVNDKLFSIVSNIDNILAVGQSRLRNEIGFMPHSDTAEN